MTALTRRLRSLAYVGLVAGVLAATSSQTTARTGGQSANSPSVSDRVAEVQSAASPATPTGVPFSCEANAVRVDISRPAGAKFVATERPARDVAEPRAFSFPSGPIRQVRVYLLATPDAGVERSSETTLELVVQTSATGDATQPVQWWRLAPAATVPFEPDRAADSLLFEANPMATCFTVGLCEATAVERVAGDEALLVLSFSRDLGGANAANWEHARLVLDFRSATPRVAVAATCGYNEGGGVCTAIDSGMMTRYDFSCPWDAAIDDFACQQNADDGRHRDFRLLSGAPSPARAGEVSSLEVAARRLAAGEPGPLVITDHSPMQIVHQLAVEGSPVVVLAVDGQFMVAERIRDGLGPLRPIAIRALVDAPASDEPRRETEGWTGTRQSRYQTTEISRTATTVVLQVLESDTFEGFRLRPHTRYWLGLERVAGVLRADALTVVTPGSYAQCGQNAVPATVSAIRRVRTPFDAVIEVQPPTLTSQDGEVSWQDQQDAATQCRQPGRVRWREGRFSVATTARPCASPQPPLYIDMGLDGAMRRSLTVREP